MGQVISLIKGRAKLRKALPKPVACKDCGEHIETARLQVQPLARRCISCERSTERRHKRAMEAARAQDIIIVRR